jgi:hypothetical protein
MVEYIFTQIDRNNNGMVTINGITIYIFSLIDFNKDN